MSILWTIIIGFVAGVIAKFLYPGKNYEPSGFILTTVLGIVGALGGSLTSQQVRQLGDVSRDPPCLIVDERL